MRKQIGNSKTIQDRHLMKFMNDKNTKLKPEGVKCFPSQVFGVSKESPDQFKTKNTLITDSGYCFDHDNQKSKQFEYYSQKHFVNLQLEERSAKTKFFSTQYNNTINQNKIAFHRRKGRLSEFMDKNGWMASTYVMMGDERNQKARSLSNKDRQSRITEKNNLLSTQRKSIKSAEKKTTIKSNLIELIMSQKLKIRKMRNQLANQQAKTSNQRASPMKNENKINFRMHSTGEKHRKMKDEPQQKQFELEGKDLDEWKEDTCGLKLSNPTKFHRRHHKQ